VGDGGAAAVLTPENAVDVWSPAFGLDRLGQVSIVVRDVARDPQRTADIGSYELWIGFLRDPDENVLAPMGEVPVRGR
jgi:hypothetical protein